MADEEVYTRSHLVLTQVNHDATENEILEEASEVVKRNFSKVYPQSEMISILPIQTISDEMNPSHRRNLSVFSTAFTATELPPRRDLNGDTDIVLIDLKGDRKDYDFTLGYYDHNLKEWMDDSIQQAITDTHRMRWMYLPLAKYEK